MTQEEIVSRFEALQQKLVPLWESMNKISADEQTIVVVPSISLEASLGGIFQAYEERFLFLLFLLRQPRARLIYVTSLPIHKEIVDYYLGLLPGIIPSHARKRLVLLSPLDSSPKPLSAKILDRPRFLRQIREQIPNLDRAHLVPYNTTELERELAVRLGIPMYGADPRLSHFGSKSGCRKIFADEGVPHPFGYNNLTTMKEICTSIANIRRKRPRVQDVIVKLNEGVSGEGNARVRLQGLPDSGSDGELDAIEQAVRGMSYELPQTRFEEYMEKFAQRGGIVEERIIGDEIRSPSVQMRVTPLGELQVLSTHDQLLGGPSGQSYLGARFPADTAYAHFISREAARIGRRLAKEGVIGRFAVDFIVSRSADDEWRSYAIEINLRKGGTTHPFLTLQFLTDGSYDTTEGVFTAPDGRQKFFVASDHVESPLYRGLGPSDLFDMTVRNRLHFDHARQTGIVFHMISALSEGGRVGLTAVEDSHEKATALYDRVVATLEAEAAAASNE